MPQGVAGGGSIGGRPLRVLHIEDDAHDARLIEDILRRDHLNPEVVRVKTREALRSALEDGAPDLVLSDFAPASLGGFEALDAVRARHPLVPFLFVTGTPGEEGAIEALQRGATDYVSKQRLTRLVPAVRRALGEHAGLEAQARAEEARRERDERFEHVARATNDAVWDWDLSTGEVWWSEGVQALFGYDPTEALRPLAWWHEHIHAEDRDRVVSAMRSVIDHPGQSWLGEYRFLKADGTHAYVLDRGSVLRDGAARAVRMIGAMMDITARKQAEGRIEYLAYHDPLTGLPNRTLLKDRLSHSLAHARRLGHGVAVLYIDLDQFKLVNDTLGHGMGDRLLQAVASRLAGNLRENDTIGRVGGDEFVILIQNVEHAAAAARVAEKILKNAEEPIELEGHSLYVTTSIGISLFPSDGDDPETLLRNADNAMYRAKDHGRSAYQLFTPEMNARAIQRLSMENALRRGLEHEEFSLKYQAQVRFDSPQVVGVEALIRWADPHRGEMLPDQFIGLAEDTRLIVPIGGWVLGAACRQAAAWRRAGLPLPRVAVNISARQFQHGDLVNTVRRSLAEAALEASCLELEITESAAMQNVDITVEKLGSLREMGIRIAFDDFGTGHASLGYLRLFPMDSLKIDRCFVRDIATNASSASIVRAIIQMAHGLDLLVIAEGVETQAQYEFLKEQGCDAYQGFLHSRPVPPAALVDLLTAGAPPVLH